jgi:hypothetical protein
MFICFQLLLNVHSLKVFITYCKIELFSKHHFCFATVKYTVQYTELNNMNDAGTTPRAMMSIRSDVKYVSLFIYS